MYMLKYYRGSRCPCDLQTLREVWKLHELPRISAGAAVGLARLDAEGCVDIISLASTGSQLLHELTSDSFKPMREAALAAYAEAPMASLVCNVAPEDLQVLPSPILLHDSIPGRDRCLIRYPCYQD